jgi:hypothetical protein
VNNVGFSYHSAGFSLIMILSITLIKYGKIDLFILLALIISIIALKGRTHIFIVAYVLLWYLLSLGFYKKITTSFLILIFLSYFVTYDFEFLSKFFPDVIDRGASVGVRDVFWACYYNNVEWISLYGSNDIIDGCYQQTWKDLVFKEHETTQYENSFFLLHSKIGLFSLPIFGYFIFAIFNYLRKKSFFLLGLFLMFIVRISTGDLMFFRHYDFLWILFVVYPMIKYHKSPELPSKA